MRIDQIDRTTNVYKLAENFFRRSSDEARQHLLEALENDPDIIDELVDFILVNAEAELYRQNRVFTDSRFGWLIELLPRSRYRGRAGSLQTGRALDDLAA
jgi:hypothetical protein